MKLPKGKLLESKKGGKGVLKALLITLQGNQFNGYLKIQSPDPARGIDGTLILQNGDIAAIIYEEQRKRTFKEEALEPIVRESAMPNNSIEVHGLDPSIILDYYPEARVDGIDLAKIDHIQAGLELSAPPSAPAPPPTSTGGIGGKEDVDIEELFHETIKTPGKEMTPQGTSSKAEAEAVLGADTETKAEAVSSVEAAGSEAPVPEQEGGVEEVSGKPEGGGLAEEGDSGEEGAIGDEHMGWGELISEFTFDNFVVGENNRFTHAAAQAVADNPARAYNPLFIYGGVGLGKTHLLNAIGNHIKKNNPTAKVVYISIENFTNELINAIRYDKINEFRARYSNVDVLLIDDIQFISGKDSTQEEFFYTFNELYKNHKQICIASDRLPKDIPKLEVRLKSRFEGGLITDIKPPNFETRLAILKRKIEREHLMVPEDVLNIIAENVTENIRELEGALNKVVAYATLTQREINTELAMEALRDVIGAVKTTESAKEKKEEKRPTAGSGEHGSKAFDMGLIKEGTSYLVEEERPTLSIEILKHYMALGWKPLCIARTNPRVLRENFGLGDADIRWLTDRDTEKEQVINPTLEAIAYFVEDYLSTSDKKVIVLLDGLEYLISMHQFTPVIRFVRQIIDISFEYDAIFLAPISPNVLKTHELKTLEREMVPLTPEVMGAASNSKSLAEAVSKISDEE